MHPAVASRSCSDCKQWMYEDSGGNFGKLLTRRDKQPIPRAKSKTGAVNTPCAFCPKIPEHIPDKIPENAVELTERNREAYDHYCECKAVSDFPNDPIVRHNAAIIRGVEDLVVRAEQQKLQMLTIKAARAGRGA